jgi:epoxyqueuosine reductase
MRGLTPAVLGRLRRVAEDVGLSHLGAARLDHEAFGVAANALDLFLDRGWQGEMAFLERSRAARKDPSRMLDGARSVLVAVAPYDGDSGHIARYAQHRDYHAVLHERLAAVERALKAELGGQETMVCVDTRPLMERAVAVIAGLGFLGKHGCLIVPGLGSYVLIAAVLCTAPWEGPDASVDLERMRWGSCGTCTACLEACPTSAFEHPGVLDPRRCVSYLTIEHRGKLAAGLAEGVGERIAGCDVCQEVCPFNASESKQERVPARMWIDRLPDGRRDVDLEAIAHLGSSGYRAFVRGTALTRIPRRQLRRNALLALGNRAGPLTDAERAVFEQALQDPEPLVREAAAWAMSRRDPATAPQGPVAPDSPPEGG